MRFRAVLVLIVVSMLLWIPETFAQKRVVATVNPNENVFNSTADIYTVTGGMTLSAGMMAVARDGAIAVQLAAGQVLIAGGYNNHYLRSAELYNPLDDSFTVTGDMMTTRVGAASVLMPNGTVLLVGGYNGNYIQTMEQYDPVAGTFGLVGGQMTTPRQYASATLLDDGTVLIAGGFNGSFLISAEIYDHAQRAISAMYSMKIARVGHSAVRIDSNGERVLIAGGCNNSNTSEMVCDSYLSSAELYNPSDGTFTLINNQMQVARKDHTATVLPDGRVLIVGGTTSTGVALASAELYNPSDGTFTATGNMAVQRVNHTASLLANGQVLIAGGESGDGQPLGSIEIYDPINGTFISAGTMSIERTLHSAVVLDNGAKVLLVGGTNEPKLVFDVNAQVLGDNVGGDIRFSFDGSTGYVAYTGSGTVVAFSTTTGNITKTIPTGGNPAFITPLIDNQYLAVTSVLDNKIFIIDTSDNSLSDTYVFDNAGFGFGSRIELSPDGKIGYISSSTTGDVIKFDVTNGDVLGRYSGMHIPAQITANSDGSVIMVVDAGSNIVEGINTATMIRKYTFAPQARYYPAAFTISNRVVLNATGTIAMVASQDSVVVSDTYSGAFIFDPSNGAWILDEDDDEDNDDEGDDGIYAVGYGPGFSTLTPNGKYWVVLSQNFLSLVPTVDPRDIDNNNKPEDGISVKNYTISGQPMGSSNVIVTSDSKYAFYASATTDHVFQMDLDTGAIIGSYPVGDEPNLSPDQPISLAMLPDLQNPQNPQKGMIAVMNFVTNELKLLVDSYVYRQTRYISQQDRFTGLVIVNDSDNEVEVTITAKTNGGMDHLYYIDNDINNPAKNVKINANDMISIDVSELFGFDNDVANEGYLVIESDDNIIVAFTAVGQIQGNFLHPYIRSMEGQPFFAMDDVSQDWVIPEIPESSDAKSEISLLNPRYSSSDYTLTHYGTDGTEMEVQENSIGASAREAASVTDTTTVATKSQVVIVGGFSKNTAEQSSETFDGSSLYYLSAVATRAPRQGHTAVALVNGKVLVAGGKSNYVIQKTAELYDPSSNTFTFAPGSMNVERYRHTATRLLNGKVLLAGGQNMRSITNTAELFDYTTGSFSHTEGEMSTPRDAHTATRLRDGTVLIAGGLDGTSTTNTAEIYDPTTETFSPTDGSMIVPRAFHTATLLNDGRVLIVGGYNGEFLGSAEIYDPATKEFEAIYANIASRSNHTATLLSDGTVLIAGGRNSTTEETGGLNTAEVYDPTNRSFTPTDNNMTFYRSYHTAVNFMDDASGDNDRVVLSGGFGISSSYSSSSSDDDDEVTPAALASSDIYTPGTRLFTTTSSSMSYARQGHTALLLDETVTSGYLRLKSDAGMLATESYTLEKGGAPTSVSAINMKKHDGIQKIYSPRFVISSGRKTLLNVINGNEFAADVTLVLHKADGDEITSKKYSLAGNAQVKGTLAEIFENSNLAPPQEGWIEVSSTMDQVVGVVTFAGETDNYLGSFELSGTPMTKFIFPLVSEDATDFETELTFLNPGTAAVSIDLELFVAGGGGTSVGGVPMNVSLAAGEKTSQKLTDLFGTGTSVTTGYVKVTATQPIYGMGEVQALSNRFITPVPPVVR